MSKVAVIYSSKYGTTKKYANWISRELSCDIFDISKVILKSIGLYDIIIFGGGLYGGGFGGVKLIEKSFKEFPNKKIILFTCGLADTSKSENTDNIKASLKKQLTEEVFEKIKIFHLRGGVDYPKLSFIHKIMMGMLHKMLKNKPMDTLSNEDREMLETYGKAVDFTDENTIKPITEYVKAL